MINRVFKRFTALMLAAVLLFSLAPTFTLTVFAATSGDLTGPEQQRHRRQLYRYGQRQQRKLVSQRKYYHRQRH